MCICLGDLRGFHPTCQTMSAWLVIARNVFIDRYAIVYYNEEGSETQ